MPISVTQVIDYLTEPELLKWYQSKSAAACKKISDESLRIGKIVDQLIQDDINGNGYLLPNGEVAIANCMRAWESFKADRPAFLASIEAIQKELVEGDIVGHPDIITENIVVDVKTSRSINPRHWTQAGKYAKMSGKSRMAILRLDKELGIYEWKEQGQDVIDYENTVFDAYLVAFKHNTTIREIVRRQLEENIYAL